jgi:hypothetical protein
MQIKYTQSKPLANPEYDRELRRRRCKNSQQIAKCGFLNKKYCPLLWQDTLVYILQRQCCSCKLGCRTIASTFVLRPELAPLKFTFLTKLN